MFRFLLLWLQNENRHLLLLRRYLAGLVEDNKEDEDEDAHSSVTNNGRDGPHRQAHPQFMVHGQPVGCFQTQYVLSSEMGLRSINGSTAFTSIPVFIDIPERKHSLFNLQAHSHMTRHIRPQSTCMSRGLQSGQCDH